MSLNQFLIRLSQIKLQFLANMLIPLNLSLQHLTSLNKLSNMNLLKSILLLQLSNILLIFLYTLLEHFQLSHYRIVLTLLQLIYVFDFKSQGFVHEVKLVNLLYQILSFMIVYIL